MSKKQTKFFGIMIVTFCILGILSGLTITPIYAAGIQFDEFQITTNHASQTQPDVYLYWIVYQDDRNGNWDIYMYDLQETIATESQVTTNLANQIEPAIHGEVIVYQDDRNGNWDIYMYNVFTKTETRITTNTASQQYPEIYGNRIVWEDNRNGHLEIYMYDLSTQTESRITNSLASQDPAISGNIITYEKQVFENNAYRWGVFYFDLTKNMETLVSMTDKYNPAIDGNHIVYQTTWMFEDYTVYRKVVMKDIISGATWESTFPAQQQNPDVSANLIVYQDNRENYGLNTGNPWDIYLYNLDTQIESKVTSNAANQFSPAIDFGQIVYVDDRNGNNDIYMTVISIAVSEPPIVRSVGPSSTLNETENREPLLGSLGPSSTLDGTENLDISDNSINISDYFIFLTTMAVVIVVVLLNVFTWYSEKYKNKTPKESLT